MPSERADVLVVGGGPAGAATALALVRLAPDLSVAIVEPTEPGGPPIGEAVPPSIRPFLAELGVLPAFETAGHARSYRTFSAWGEASLAADEFLLHAESTGWRLDRARFDAMLLGEAETRGALRIPARLTGLTRTKDGWDAELGTFGGRSARIVIDATGRAAIACRLAGRRIERHDRQIAAVGVIEPLCAAALHEDDKVVVTEAGPDGWWYSAGLPGGERVVAFMTDGDIACGLGLKRPARFLDALARTEHVARLTGRHPAARDGEPRLRLVAAGSARTPIAAGDNLIAVGDSAMAFDPIAGLGIVKALRSGLYASYAIVDALVAGDPRGFARYQALAERDYAAYRRRHAEVYRRENRWPSAPYWARRRG